MHNTKNQQDILASILSQEANIEQFESSDIQLSPSSRSNNISRNTSDHALTSGTESFSLTIPHLSPDKPPRPEFTPFTVPHFCASMPYDGKGFWTFPERHGWIVHAKDTNCHVLCPPGKCYDGMSAQEILDDDGRVVRPSMFSHANGTPVCASDKVAFLQAWLFFGLLTEISAICGLNLDVEAEFIDDEGMVSTSKLNGLPGRWFAATVRKGCAGDKVLMEQILRVGRHAMLMLVEELVGDTRKFTRMYKYTYPECCALHSLDIAARVIGLHLLLHVYMPGFTAVAAEGWGKNRISISLDWDSRYGEGMDQLSRFAHGSLKERGWCNSELDLMAADDLAFASLLPRPNIRDHSGCGDTICGAYQTDEDDYRTEHVEVECTCDFVSVPTSILVDALSKDKVPKLVITEHLELQMVSEHNYPYIAISHVWADGLGNPFTNALPGCQLRRLRNCSYQLYSMTSPVASADLPVALWMDTLCIPVDASAKVYRKKAIQLLGKTFNEANAVLILDRELEVIESATSSFLELGLRILCSGWVKRLWTLQEASLASEAHGEDKIYFHMRDEPFLYQKYDRNRRAVRRVDDETTEVQAEERTLLNDYGIMLELGAQVPSVRAMRDMREGWSPFRVIYTALEHRSTSKVEDVPVCIASLVGKDISTILSTAGLERRMANFYLVMREVPHRVVWCEQPQKLSIKPFRWAPLSITACPQSTFMGQEVGVCDSAGLHVRFRGFVFGGNEEEWQDEETVFPRVFKLVSSETGEVLGQLSRPPQRAPWKIPLQRNLAVILRQDAHPGVLPTAALVTVEATAGEDNGTRTPELVCRIVGYMYFQSPDRAREDGVVFRGYALAADQMWCIT